MYENIKHDGQDSINFVSGLISFLENFFTKKDLSGEISVLILLLKIQEASLETM